MFNHNFIFSTAEAISKVKGQNLSERFKDMFLPGGHALAPGSLLKIPTLVAILDAGVSEFYNGNLSRELSKEVNISGLHLHIWFITQSAATASLLVGPGKWRRSNQGRYNQLQCNRRKACEWLVSR